MVFAHFLFLNFIGHLDHNTVIVLLHRKGEVDLFGVFMVTHINPKFSDKDIQFADLFFCFSQLLL